MENEEDVLDWMVGQKQDESIEKIDRETLFEYIGSKDFLAVIFCEYPKQTYFTMILAIFNLLGCWHRRHVNRLNIFSQNHIACTTLRVV